MGDSDSEASPHFPGDEKEPAMRRRGASRSEKEDNDLSKQEAAALNRIRDRRHDYLYQDSGNEEANEMAAYKAEMERVSRRAPLATGEGDVEEDHKLYPGDDEDGLTPSYSGGSLGPPPAYPGTPEDDHDPGGLMMTPGEAEQRLPGNDIELRELDSGGGAAAPKNDLDLRNMEEAPVPEDARSQTGDSDYKCVALGPLNPLGTRLAQCCLRSRRQLKHSVTSSPTRLALVLVLVAVVLAIILFLGLFPPSVITVEYYQVALKRSKLTGAVDRHDVLMSGCHVLTPDVELVIYNATGQILPFSIDVFTIDSLVISMEMAIVFLLKPAEIAQLHAKFEMDYEPVFLSVMQSTIKNAAMQFDREDYRLRRRDVERTFFSLLHRKMGGDCCAACCPSRCTNSSVCVGCRPPGQCDQAYHADVQQVYLMNVNIPDDVQERYMQRALLQVDQEKELFIQQQKVTEKQTLRETSLIRNEAAEKVAEGQHSGYVILQEGEAEREVEVTQAYVESLHSTFSLLNVSQESHKTSIMMMRAFEDIADNLYYSYDYEVLTGYSP